MNLGSPKKFKISNVLLFLVMVAVGITFLYPLYYIIINSLKPLNAYYKDPLGLPTMPFAWSNFKTMINKFHIFTFVRNTLIIMICSMVLYLPMAVCNAFTFAKYRFRGSNLMYFLMVAGMSMPGQVTCIPLYVGLGKLGLVDTYAGMILLFLSMSFGSTVMMTAFFRGVPTEVLESAKMDGCGYFKNLFYMVLPMAKPVIAIQVITGFNGIWNALFMPKIFLRKDEVKMLMPAIAELADVYDGSPVHMFAGFFIAIIPSLIIYIVFRKQIINGITAGAVKG